MAIEGALHNGRYLILFPSTVITTAVTAFAGPVFGVVTGDALQGNISATQYQQDVSLACVRALMVQCVLTVGGGGTTANLYVQTSLDHMATWFDIMNFSFTTSTATKISAVNTNIAPASQAFTPTNGTLTANTIVQGVIGPYLRCILTTTGTYTTNTTIAATAQAQG